MANKSAVEIEIKGFDELNKKLAMLEDRMFRKYARAGVNKVAQTKKKLQQAMAPTSADDPDMIKNSGLNNSSTGNRGDLRRSIKVKPSSRWRSAAEMAAKGVVGASVGPRQNEGGGHAHLIEFGHTKKTVVFENDEGEIVVIRRQLQVSPKPFIRPAFDLMKLQQNSIFAHEIRKRMERDLAKAK